jgi:hypothetical protein
VAILFFFSWVFPVAVGLAKDTASFPKWWGPVDVTVAFVLAISAIGLQATVGRMVDKAAEESAYRAYRILTHGILALGVSVMLGRPEITWANCATGFTWRAWLGLYLLPWWLTALRR